MYSVPYFHCHSLYSQGGYTALMYAVTEDNVGIARELLLAGADPTFRDKVHVYELVYAYMYMYAYKIFIALPFLIPPYFSRPCGLCMVVMLCMFCVFFLCSESFLSLSICSCGALCT